MIRMVGSALVTGACLWTGWSRLQWYRRRRRTLSDFGHALARMEAELSGRETDTGQLLALLAEGGDRAAPVFRRCLAGLDRLEDEPFHAIWTRALEESGLALRPAELAVLGRVGAVLGRYDGPIQGMMLAQLRREVERCLEEAREEERRQSRTALLLSLTVGLTVVLLLN